MNLKEELSRNNLVLVTMDSLDYAKGVMKTAAEFSQEKVVYVVLDRSYTSVDTKFKKGGIDTENFFYINITREKMGEKESARHYYLSSNSALTELAIVINNLLKKGYRYVFFDSITNLLIYNDGMKTQKFLIDLANKIKQAKAKGVYYAVENDSTKELIDSMNMVADKAIAMSLR